MLDKNAFYTTTYLLIYFMLSDFLNKRNDTELKLSQYWKLKIQNLFNRQDSTKLFSINK